MPKRSKKKRTSTCNTAEELVKPEPPSIAAQMIPASIHPHLQFASDLPHSNEYLQRLIGLLEKPFDEPWVVDWDALDEVGLDMDLKRMLRQHYSPDRKRTYNYQELEELLYKREPVYQELCWEFHSTYFLKEKPESMKDKDFMRFRLGGVDRHMSLNDFTKCLKIYLTKQMDEDHFSDYIWSGARVSAMNEADFNANEVWQEFSSGSTWSPGGVSHLDIDDIKLRLIRLFLTHAIFHRKESTEKVSLFDLWFLQHIRSKTHVNIPYCVAYYLKHWAIGVHPNSPICGRHFVTLIADYLGVKCDANEGIKEVTLKTHFFSYSEYRKAKVISDPDQDEHDKERFEILDCMEKFQLQKEETLKEGIEMVRLHHVRTVSAGLRKLSEQITEIKDKLFKKI